MTGDIEPKGSPVGLSSTQVPGKEDFGVQKNRWDAGSPLLKRPHEGGARLGHRKRVQKKTKGKTRDQGSAAQTKDHIESAVDDGGSNSNEKGGYQRHG